MVGRRQRVAVELAQILLRGRLPLEIVGSIAPSKDRDRAETGAEIGRTLADFVAAFDRKLTELADSNVCECIACQQMVTLRLKLIGHYGIATRSQVAGFDELSGVDVIVPHRLLKNGVQGSEYILLIEAAYRFAAPPGEYVVHRERYDDVGEIDLRVRSLAAQVPAAAPRRFSLRDMARKIGYDVTSLLTRSKHPAR